MSTPKDKIVPGTILIVDNPELPLTRGPGTALDGYIKPEIGEELEIISAPKKYQAINCVQVKYRDTELFAYYMHIRFSTSVK